MKQIIRLFLILLTLSSTLVFAHNGQNYYRYGDIDTKLNKRAILEIAKQELRRLVITNKIPDSWKYVDLSNIQKNRKSHSNSWVVSFSNPKIKKKSKKVIYLFISATGDIIASAYSHH